MKKISKREGAINLIKYEFATNGKSTALAMSTYIENKISYATFQKAAKQGLNYFKKMNNK